MGINSPAFYVVVVRDGKAIAHHHYICLSSDTCTSRKTTRAGAVSVVLIPRLSGMAAVGLHTPFAL
ncbi:hypothetical protein HC891_28000 [Candidatus Gracilibacteria bacterium]|nr:hypothetical protein [Candidatus Gracilibacteria bacterium]